VRDWIFKCIAVFEFTLIALWFILSWVFECHR
jgi:hypothetical protein